MTSDQYHDWLRVAARFSRVASEVEDLLQEALLIAAVEDRSDLSLETNQRWLSGVLRKLAAMHARSAVRRRAREAEYASANERLDSLTPAMEWRGATWIAAMPPAARIVLVLALHGLTSDEICSVLDISNTAFRQRLTTIRRSLTHVAEDDLIAILDTALQRQRVRRTDIDLGPLRNSLLAVLRTEAVGSIGSIGSIGTHDPSGHPLVIRTHT